MSWEVVTVMDRAEKDVEGRARLKWSTNPLCCCFCSKSAVTTPNAAVGQQIKGDTHSLLTTTTTSKLAGG